MHRCLAAVASATLLLAACAPEPSTPSRSAETRAAKPPRSQESPRERCAKRYGTVIVAPDQVRAPATESQRDLRAALEDLETTLERMSKASFAIVDAAPGATAACPDAREPIHVVQARDLAIMTALPAEVGTLAAKLDQREAFVLHARPGHGLWIVATHPSGLRNGIYEYLDRLGVRWLLPNPRFEIVPERDDLRIEASVLKKPAFRSVWIGAEYGLGGGGKLGELGKASDADWQAWKRRNRFPVEYRAPRQVGSEFNTKYRQELERFDAHRPLVDGKRLPWSLGMRWNTTFNGCGKPPGACRKGAMPNATDYESTSGGVVGLVSQWARERYEQSLKLDPESPDSELVSIEEADGTGRHCECKKCLNLLRKARYLTPSDRDSSRSDRVFHLARQVAHELAERPPRLPDGTPVSRPGVGLLAYTDHLAPPSLPLLPNMYVHVVAYVSGEYAGVTPEELVEQWAAKRDKERFHLGISHPLTTDRPEVSPYAFAELVRGWLRRGVEGLTLSSTLSAGETAIPFYVLSRQIWDPKLDEHRAVEELFRLAFGKDAGRVVKRMYDRWWRAPEYDSEQTFRPWLGGFALTENELALARRDLREARSKLGNCRACAQRLGDVDTYVEYLRLRLQLENSHTPEPSPAHDAATAALARHLTQSYSSNFVHGWRVQRRILFNGSDCNTAQSVSDEVCRAWHPLVGAGHRAARSTPPVRDPGALSIHVEPRTFSKRWVALAPTAGAIGTQTSEAFRRGHRFALVSTGADVEVRVQSRLDAEPAAKATVAQQKLVVRDAGGAVVRSWPLPWNDWGRAGEGGRCVVDGKGRKCLHTLALSALPAGSYTLDVTVVVRSGQSYALEMPRSVPFALVGRQYNPQSSGKQYFFVPRGTKRFGLIGRQLPRAEPQFELADGTAVRVRRIGTTLRVIDVPRGADGAVWSVQGLTSYAISYKLPYVPNTLLGVPSIFAFASEQLLVPDEVR